MIKINNWIYDENSDKALDLSKFSFFELVDTDDEINIFFYTSEKHRFFITFGNEKERENFLNNICEKYKIEKIDSSKEILKI